MALSGNRVIADVIKAGSVYEIIWDEGGVLHPMTGLLIRRRKDTEEKASLE